VASPALNVGSDRLISYMAARLGFEPRTYRLTAGRSTVELSGNETSPMQAGVYHKGGPNGAVASVSVEEQISR
jgi:hypothetical protein